MRLRGIDFGHVWAAPGAMGFFSGDELFHYRWADRLGLLDDTDVTFAARTSTLEPQQGHLPLVRNGYGPKHMLPSCVWFSLRQGEAASATGNSGPGLRHLLDHGPWQKRQRPFCLSVIGIGGREDREVQMIRVVEILRERLKEFSAPVALQLDFTRQCHGSGHVDLVSEARGTLSEASVLGIPLLPKLNVLLAPEAAHEIAQHPSCDALCISGGLPWGALPEVIDWNAVTPQGKSPLKKYGGGVFTGRRLFKLVYQWLAGFRALNRNTMVLAGGGVRSASDVRILSLTGADAVTIGSLFFLRPWRVRDIVQEASHAMRLRQAERLL